MKSLREVIVEGVFDNNITSDTGPVTDSLLIKNYIVNYILNKYNIPVIKDSQQTKSKFFAYVTDRDNELHLSVNYNPAGSLSMHSPILLHISFISENHQYLKKKYTYGNEYDSKRVWGLYQLDITKNSELLSSSVHTLNWSSGAVWPKGLKFMSQNPYLQLRNNKNVITYENITQIRDYFDDVVGKFIDCIKSNESGAGEYFLMRYDDVPSDIVKKFKKEIKRII